MTVTYTKTNFLLYALWLVFLLAANVPVMATQDLIAIEEWVSHYKCTGESQDYFSAMTIDSSGNVYLTERSTNGRKKLDYLTIKYNASGERLWMTRYNGPADGFDIPRAIAVDVSGNVYVTGASEGIGTGDDYLTVKYDRDGLELWQARYSGSGVYEDEAFAIAVDSSGNVYVTGRGFNSGSGSDYVTVKYNANGRELWQARYNGPGNGFDKAVAMNIDSSGNIYVTGWSYANGSGFDYATVKYDTNGNELWAAPYNGPKYGDDYAQALAVDESGNVYVTGSSEGIGAGDDYFTVKYDTNGNKLWEARYDGPANAYDGARAIVVDSSGNVYVTGDSLNNGTSVDYLTIKYDASGGKLWEARYNGPGNGEDSARAIAIDTSGHVYVTGNSFDSSTGQDYTTIKYDSSGVQKWQPRRYNGPGNADDIGLAIAVDSSGNVYVTGDSSEFDEMWPNYDNVTVKYDTNGYTRWEVLYSSPGNFDDEATATTFDRLGNIYVTGNSPGKETGLDYITVKYDTDGNELWHARYNGPGNGDDKATAIAVDFLGNVYVTGKSQGSSTNYDYATVKYGVVGNQLWEARYNGPGNSNDWPGGLAVDVWGNVYVTGGSPGSGTGCDYATVKYDTNGNKRWEARYNSPGNFSDWANAIAVDVSGNVYVTGRGIVNLSGNFYTTMYVTVKYSQPNIDTYNEEWLAQYNGPGNDYDEPWDIAVDSSGNVYVTGESVGIGRTNTDYATVKYDALGNQQWAARYEGPGNVDGRAKAIAIDSSGNVYVTGWSYGGPTNENGTDDDYATVKYDAHGNQKWIARYNGPGNGKDRPSAVAIDSSGKIYVTGNSYGGSLNGFDFATIKYNSYGDMMWEVRYNGPGNGDDRANAMAIDLSGAVYVTGKSHNGWSGGYENSGSSTGYDFTTVKYSQGNTYNQLVPIDAGNGVTVTFEKITRAGNTTAAVTNQGPSPSTDFQLVPSGTYYEITTTATYADTITVCINYDDTNLTPEQEDNLNLRRFDEVTNEWLNITTLLDTGNNVICGETSHLSLFGVMKIYEPVINRIYYLMKKFVIFLMSVLGDI